MIHLDTHVLVWLYLPRLDLLSARAREALDQQELSISPIVLLELEFLREIGRLRVGANDLFQSLHAQLGITVDHGDLRNVVASALPHLWTRDPFDRLIVGQAVTSGAELLTRDETIREHFAAAIW